MQPILLDLVSLDLQLALVYVFAAGFSLDIWASYNYFALGLQYFCIEVCDHSLGLSMGSQHFFSRIYNMQQHGFSFINETPWKTVRPCPFSLGLPQEKQQVIRKSSCFSNEHLIASWPKIIVLGLWKGFPEATFIISHLIILKPLSWCLVWILITAMVIFIINKPELG